MVNQELQAYVKAQREAGSTPEQLREALLQSGWPEDQVNDVLKEDALPVVIATPPTASASDAQKVLKMRSKRLLFLVIGIVVILLLIGGLVAYFVVRSMSAPTFG